METLSILVAHIITLSLGHPKKSHDCWVGRSRTQCQLMYSEPSLERGGGYRVKLRYFAYLSGSRQKDSKMMLFSERLVSGDS